MKKNNLGTFLLMHAGFLIYSFYTIIGKYAAKYNEFSLYWCIFYAIIIFILGIYAIIWQQVLKFFTLPIAMCNKAITIVWGMAFSRFFFIEEITLKKILGASIILCGIILLSFADTKDSKQ